MARWILVLGAAAALGFYLGRTDGAEVVVNFAKFVFTMSIIGAGLVAIIGLFGGRGVR